MPILDDAAANASLSNDYGPTRGAAAPDSHEVELWDGDPSLLGSAELVGNGYASATALPADWSAPADRKTSATVTFGAPTAEWVPATHYVLRDPVTGFAWDYGPLSEPLYVTGAGAAPSAVITVFYDEEDLT